MSLFYRVIKDQWLVIIAALAAVLVSCTLISLLLLQLSTKEEWIQAKREASHLINNLTMLWDEGELGKIWNNYTEEIGQRIQEINEKSEYEKIHEEYDRNYYGKMHGVHGEYSIPYYYEKCTEKCTIIYQVLVDEIKEYHARWRTHEGIPGLSNTNVDIQIEEKPWSRTITSYDTSGKIKEKIQCQKYCGMEKLETKPFNFYDLHDKNE